MKNNTFIYILLFTAVLALSFQLATPIKVAACVTDSECPADSFSKHQFCSENNLYQTRTTYSCINSTCVSNGTPSLLQQCNGQCVDGLWYTGCVSSSKSGNNSNNNNSGYIIHSYQRCSGNSVVWFDSNGNQQDTVQSCSVTQMCQNNACVANPNATNYNDTTYTYPSYNTNNTYNTYILHSSKGCYNNSIYWYDSSGNESGVYQNCSTTGQMCQNAVCIANTVRHAAYTPPPAPVTQKPVAVKASKNLIISLFGQKDSTSSDWKKSIVTTKDGKVNFLVTVKNISKNNIDNVLVKVDLTSNLTHANDLLVDDVTSGENITTGVHLDSIAANTSRIILFSATTVSENEAKDVSIVGTVGSPEVSDSDSMTITIEKPARVAAASIGTAASSASVSSSLLNGFKRWYIWILTIITLIIFFFVIFKRLSSNI